MKKRKVTTQRERATADGPSYPFGHCAGCFGIKDSRTSHYPGTVEHPFTERQADNYKLGREIDEIATEV